MACIYCYKLLLLLTIIIHMLSGLFIHEQNTQSNENSEGLKLNRSITKV